MVNNVNLWITIITSITTIIVSIIAYKQNTRIKIQESLIEDNNVQFSLYEDLLNIVAINEISKAVSKTFEDTKADRFLLLVGIEHLGLVKYITVIFEQHKAKDHVNAIATYRNLEIDEPYRNMINMTRATGLVNLETITMQESLLKQIYLNEGVTYSKIRFIGEKEINKEKKIVSISSMSTHNNTSWSESDKIKIKLMYESTIIPLMEKLMRIETEKFQ